MNKCCLSPYYECKGEAKSYKVYSGSNRYWGVANYCDSCSTDEKARGYNLFEVERELVTL